MRINPISNTQNQNRQAFRAKPVGLAEELLQGCLKQLSDTPGVSKTTIDIAKLQWERIREIFPDKILIAWQNPEFKDGGMHLSHWSLKTGDKVEHIGEIYGVENADTAKEIIPLVLKTLQGDAKEKGLPYL